MIAGDAIEGAASGIQGTLDKVTNALSGGGQGLFSIFDSGMAGQIWFWFRAIMMMAGVGFALLLFYKFYLQYKVRVTIWRRMGAGWESKGDMAKMIVDKDGKRKLQLFKTRNGKTPITCPVPESTYLTKKGKKDHYTVFLDNNFQLHPIKPPSLNEGDLAFNVIPQDRTAWGRFEDRVLASKFKKVDFIEKYLPSVIIVSAMTFAFLIFFFGFKELGTQMAKLGTQFAQIASACTSLTP